MEQTAQQQKVTIIPSLLDAQKTTTTTTTGTSGIYNAKFAKTT
jgi:hypothetical protein